MSLAIFKRGRARSNGILAGETVGEQLPGRETADPKIVAESPAQVRLAGSGDAAYEDCAHGYRCCLRIGGEVVPARILPSYDFRYIFGYSVRLHPGPVKVMMWQRWPDQRGTLAAWTVDVKNLG